MPNEILKTHARWILDSRGFPTVEVEVTTDKGTFRAAVPSGASTGIHEACELRDGGDAFLGKHVTKAIGHVNNDIAPGIVGMDVTDLRAIDNKMNELDGTSQKTNFGANAILGVSMAVARAAAAAKDMPLYKFLAEVAGTTDKMCMPTGCYNVLNGGSHAGNALPIQEYMIAPIGAESFAESYQMAAEVYHHLKTIIKKQHGIDAVNVGDEGGFAPPLADPEEPLQLLVAAIEAAGYTGRIKICMDCAASEFLTEDGQYNLNFKGEEPKLISGEDLAATYAQWVEKYPIVSIEDPFDQEFTPAWSNLTASVKGKCAIVGDDLTVSTASRVQTAIEKKSCDALLLKVNQCGSVTEAIDAANLAFSAGWGVMVSHRSGETEDCFVADLVVALGSGQIKTGAPCRSERVAKYNELLRIEETSGLKFITPSTWA